MKKSLTKNKNIREDLKELIVEIQKEFESGLDQFRGLDELELEADRFEKEMGSRSSISAGGIILILGLFA